MTRILAGRLISTPSNDRWWAPPAPGPAADANRILAVTVSRRLFFQFFELLELLELLFFELEDEEEDEELPELEVAQIGGLLKSV